MSHRRGSGPDGPAGAGGPVGAAGRGAGDQLVRLLTLVPFLHARGRVDVGEAAALLDVDRDQVVADLKVLFMCGLPGGYPDDLIDVDIDALEGEDADGVIRVANAEYLARPLRLSPTEASAMIVAVRALRAGADDRSRPIVDRVLTKLEVAAASAPAVEPGADDAGDPGAALSALAARLRGAVGDGRQVRLRYWVPARDEVSERVVDPRGVATHAGHDYLDAFCHVAAAPRLFRLDRVAEAEVLTTPVATPAEDPRDLDAAPPLPAAGTTTLVTLRLAPEARWVPEYHRVEDVRPAGAGPPGSVEVDLPVADQRWLDRLLLRLSPHAEVVAPSSAAAAVRDVVAATLALYDDA